MVSSDQPSPGGFGAKDLLRAVRNGPPRCVTCNSDLLNGRRDNQSTDSRWCETCSSFQKVYRGAMRRSLCHSCFNCIRTHRGRSNQCAALMYQMPDGTWRDRYNQDHRAEYRNMGQEKIRHPIKPSDIKSAIYDCECYEFSDQSRDEIKLQDPLRFYDRSRFFDADHHFKKSG